LFNIDSKTLGGAPAACVTDGIDDAAIDGVADAG
jgi:hypothetical protein